MRVRFEQARESKPNWDNDWVSRDYQVSQNLQELKKKGILLSRFSGYLIKSMMNWGRLDESIQQAMDMADWMINFLSDYLSFLKPLTKQLFVKASTIEVPKRLSLPDDLKPKMGWCRKPILPSAEELEANNLSHSAKLRVMKRFTSKRKKMAEKMEKTGPNTLQMQLKQFSWCGKSFSFSIAVTTLIVI